MTASVNSSAPDSPEALISTLGNVPVVAFTRPPSARNGDELAHSIMQAFQAIAPDTVHPEAITLNPPTE